MTATLDMTCSCAGAPFHDEDLALSDAGLIRTWTMLHSGPGHTVTATIVAAHDATPAPTSLSRLHHAGRALQTAVAGLLRP